MEKHPLRVFKERSGTIEELKELLSDDVKFSSPVLTRPLEGKDIVAKVMMIAGKVRGGNFTHEFCQGNDTVLIWNGIIDNQEITGFELIESDDRGKITHRTLACRPYPVVALFRNAMYEQLKGEIPEDMWNLQNAVDSNNRTGLLSNLSYDKKISLPASHGHTYFPAVIF